MAYARGTANSPSDLLTGIRNACTANGWTLSGDVLHKGTCYVEVKVEGTQIRILGGTGIDGSNALAGPANTAVRYFAGTYLDPFTFPATYFVHINTGPDEVYVVCNYAVNRYQMMAFGVSAMDGLTGTGNWYSGGRMGTTDRPGQANGANGNKLSGCPTQGLFYADYDTGALGGVDHSLDSATWLVEGSWRDWASAFFRQPNQWNSEAVLIPVRVYAPRPSGFVSPVLECAHARFVSVANLNDGQIITLGSDKWKIYPFWSRSNSLYGRFAGHAFRYDGP